ncbi:unnamed protein product [Tilletia laevis]|uniref:Uncharacterized protein n=1 Tax=Tilletia laevis TaxID=157183 RepID=A0A9N8LZT7_9BASI|nr:unnamed protein product [Tilletia laevis]CAD6961589.1 unnamed protein product [Tilletia laevis]
MKTYTSSRKVKNKQRLRREHPVPACDAGAFMTIGQELCGPGGGRAARIREARADAAKRLKLDSAVVDPQDAVPDDSSASQKTDSGETPLKTTDYIPPRRHRRPPRPPGRHLSKSASVRLPLPLPSAAAENAAIA